MRVELKFSTTWTEYEAEKGIQITDVLHKGLDPADNEARVTFVQNITLYNLFRGMTPGQKVPARIYDDSDALVFFGYIARSFSVTKKQRLQPIEVQLVSPTNYLKSKIPETHAYTAIRVSAASAAIPSLVRHVLNDAGYVDADIVIPDITATIPAIVIEENTQTYFDVVKNALKEYGYILDFDETGKTKYYELFPASVTSTHTFDGSNIRVSVVQSIRPEEYDAVHVQYPEVETVTAALLFKDTTDPAGLNDCTVNIDPSSYLNGEEFWYAEYSSDRGEILAASGASLDIVKDAEISVLSFSGLAKRAKLSIRNTSVTLVRTIRRLRITGSAVVKTGVSVVKRAKTTETEKVYEFDTQYIFAKADAENLANKLASYFDTSDFTYTLGSEDRVAIGAIVTVTETGIGSNLCRVTERKYDGKIGLYTYKLEAIANYVAPPVSSSDRYVFNSPESAGTIDALAGEIAARPTSSTLSTAPATPASLIARAVQDGIILLAAPGGAPGLDNSAAYYRYQVSRDGGLTWPGDWTAAAQAEFRFDRDVDGYPDSVSLYRAQVKAVSAAGVESVSWLTVTVDGTGYLGWTPGTPGLSGSATGRNVNLSMAQGGAYYGHAGYDVQVQRDGDADWYAIGDSAAAYTDETAYRSGAAGGYSTTPFGVLSQRVPLINQSVNLPEDTGYLYRVRAVVAKPTTSDPYARAVSDWSAATAVTALGTGIKDVVENAIQTAAIQPSAVTLDKLNVLAKNLVNPLTVEAEGTTGWTLNASALVEVDSSIARRALNMPAVIHVNSSTPFDVEPDDIIEVSSSFRAITATTTARLRLGVDGTVQLQYSIWNTTTKTWGTFATATGGGGTYQDCQLSAVVANYTRVKTYVVGQNVQPSEVPAPVGATYCVRVVSSPTVGIGLVVIGTTSRVYAFAPLARNTAGGLITAERIMVASISAISSKLGAVYGDDTANYKLILGAVSGEADPEGTFLLGALTDSSYFRRYYEGGVWKMAMKLQSFYVDAVSSKILGIFRVRNSADTATVFEVDPVNGISSLINHKFPVGTEYNGSCKHHKYAGKNYASVIYIHIARMRYSTDATYDLVKIALSGGRWTGYKTAMDVYLTAREGVKGRHIGTIENVTVEVWDNGTKYDVWMKIAGTYSTATAEVTINGSPDMELGSGGVTSSPAGSLVWASGALADRVSLDLADVSASSLAVLGSASVSGNAQVGSLNGATPRAGGLELLGLGDVDVVISAKPIQIGSGLSISGVVYPALAALNSTDVAFIDDVNDQLRTYRWSGSSWSQIGSGLSISGVVLPALAALNSTDVAFIDEGNDQLRTYRWSGSSWSQIGSGLSISGVFSPALAALNSTDVAFIDSGNDQLRTYRWSGSSWSQIGSGLSISGVVLPALAALNSTDVAFIDEGNDQLRTYRWSGSSWSQIGSGLSISGVVYPALAALNSTDVAFIDDVNDQLRTYRWSGSSWSQIGSGLSISGVSYPALAALNSTDVAFIDSVNDQLRTYRYSVDGTIPTIPTANVASEYTIEQTLVTANIIFNVGCKQATVYEVITGLLGTTEGDIGCSGRYGTSDVGYLYIKSTEVTIRNVATTLVRIVCTKDSATTITSRLVLMFPV